MFPLTSYHIRPHGIDRRQNRHDIKILWISISEYRVVDTIEYSSEMIARHPPLKRKVKIQSAP